MKGNVTFVVFARDEEHRIKYLLRNIRGYGDILIMLDDRTVDKTAKICEENGVKIYPLKYPKTNGYFPESKEIVDIVFSLVKTDWIYWLFVDELLAKGLLEKIVELSHQDRYKIVCMRRHNYDYGGVNLRNGWQTRLFREGTIDFTGNFAGKFGKVLVPKDEVLYLPRTDKYSIHHFSTYTLEKFELAHGRYSRLEAEGNISHGIHFSGFRLIAKPAYFFLNFMIVGGAWRWGWRGLIIAANYSFFYFNTIAKMWEIENGVTLDSMEKHYDAMKEKLLHYQNQ